jgi:hypothetical protein
MSAHFPDFSGISQPRLVQCSGFSASQEAYLIRDITWLALCVIRRKFCMTSAQARTTKPADCHRLSLTVFSSCVPTGAEIRAASIASNSTAVPQIPAKEVFPGASPHNRLCLHQLLSLLGNTQRIGAKLMLQRDSVREGLKKKSSSDNNPPGVKPTR